MKIVKLILCILFGLMFLNAGLDKLFHYMPTPELSPAQQEMFGSFMKIVWLMPLVGIVEAIGGLLFMIPKTHALGAIVILPVMVGIVLNAFITDKSSTGMAISSVLMLINLWMIADNWNRYKPMIQ